MLKKGKKIWYIIPKEFQKKVFPYILYSFLNMLLDLLSIAILIPFILLILDTNKASELLYNYFGLAYQSDYLILSLFLLVLFFVIKNIFQTRLIRIQSVFMYQISSKISQNLVDQYLHTSLKNQTAIHKGNLIRDFQKLPIIYVTHILMPIFIAISELLFIVIITFFGFYSNFILTTLSILLLFIGFRILLLYRNKKIKNLNQSIAESFLEEVNNLLNIFFGFLEIKSTRTENYFLTKFLKSNTKHNNQLSFLQVIKQSNYRYFEILIVLFITLLLIYFKLVNYVQITAITVSIFSSIFLKLIPSTNKILVSWFDINANFHSVDILLKYANIKNTSKKVPLDFKHSITLECATFKYNKRKILDNLTVSIKKGSFVHVTGKSGVGKTTFLKVLSGLISLEKGNLKLDNLLINKSSDFFPFVGYVPQKPFLFKGSIQDNLTMFEKESTNLKWLHTLIDKMQLTEFIEELPNGIKTEIDMDSTILSGGQKQRITLIRVLYKKPSLLLLDEATNQLNKELETQILSFLHEISQTQNTTIILASHKKIDAKYISKQIHF